MYATAALILLLLSSEGARAFGQTSQPDLEALVKTHQWPQLRAAVAGKDHVTYYRAISAAVFNEPQAEALFKKVIREGPGSDQAYEAYDWLTNLYLKTGRYRSATTIMEARWKAFPNKKDVASERKDLEPFRGLPDQKNGKLKVSTLHHDAQSLAVPLAINQHEVHFFFDDGADLSCISEQQARALGMEIHATSGSMNSMTRKTGFRMATAHHVTIGAIHFSEVSFAVFPDDQEPWSLVPMGQRGIIGMPLMISTGMFRWKADGTLTIGEKPERLEASRANLFLDGGKHLVMKAGFQGQEFWAAVDTGATTTDVYATFALHFSDYLKQKGRSGTAEIRGMGGADTFESIDVAELPLQLDGHEVTLRPAHVLTKRSERRDWIYANIGKDLLMQTSGFIIDFGAMRLTLQ